MLSYQAMPDFNPSASQRRVEQAARLLGSGVVARLLAIALYLLGASRKASAAVAGMPLDTLKSLIQRVMTEGLPALEDRRRRSSAFLPPAAGQRPKIEPKLTVEEERVVVELDEATRVEIPRKNRVQWRILLLTLLSAKLLTVKQVADASGLSCERTRKLVKKLVEEDVVAVMDQRRGQVRDYRVTDELKGELIQQFVLNLEANVSTSSQQLSEDLKERSRISLAPRTIGLHVAKLGLGRLRESLPKLLAGLRKTPEVGGRG